MVDSIMTNQAPIAQKPAENRSITSSAVSNASTVPEIDLAEDVIEVAPGYARNFLLPQGKAQNVTPAVMKQVEHRKAKQLEQEAALKQEALDFQTALITIGRFTVKKQIGEDEVLFGTVTNGDVAEVIEEATKKL